MQKKKKKKKKKKELVQLELGANNKNIDPRHTVNFNENFWTNGILFHAYNSFHKISNEQ